MVAMVAITYPCLVYSYDLPYCSVLFYWQCFNDVVPLIIMITTKFRFILRMSCIHMTHIYIYRKVSNIRRTLVGNKNVDHSDVVGASPVGAAPTTSSIST